MKKKNYLWLLLFVLLSKHVAAQYVFQKSFFNSSADKLNDIIQTADGGFATIGQSLSATNTNDVWFLKTNVNGDVEHSRTYASSGNETGNTIKQLSNGDYLICGNTTGSLTTATSKIFLAKLNATGLILWSKTYDAPKDEFANSIIITNSNEIIIAGSTTSIGIAYPKGLLIKVDFNGNLIWSKVYTQINSQVFNKVISTVDGGYLAVGSFSAFGNTDKDMVVTKVDSAGSLQWSYSFGDLSEDEAFDAIQVGIDYYISGYSSSAGSGSRDFFMAQLNTNGLVMNGRVIGTSLSETAYSIHLYDPLTLLVVGYSELNVAAPFKKVGTLFKSDLNLNVYQALYLGDTLAQNGVLSSVITNIGKVAMAGFYGPSGQTNTNGFIAQNNLSYSQVCNEYYPLVAAIPYIPNTNAQTYVGNATLTEQNFAFTTTTLNTVANTLCFTSNVTNIDSKLTLSIMPNPVIDKLTFNFNEEIATEIVSINITSVAGAFILKAGLHGKNTIDVSDLKAGIYFVQINTNKHTFFSKFVKQ